jgi:hypothetical protein
MEKKYLTQMLKNAWVAVVFRMERCGWAVAALLKTLPPLVLLVPLAVPLAVPLVRVPVFLEPKEQKLRKVLLVVLTPAN